MPFRDAGRPPLARRHLVGSAPGAVRVGTLVAASLAVALAASTFTTPAAQAVDASVIEAVNGVFANPSRPDTLAIECLQYGTGEPTETATFSPVGAPDPGIQTSTPDVLNQVRAGQIPQGFAGRDGVCSPTPGAQSGLGSSGFGFDGSVGPTSLGTLSEVGRFTHYNRTIERGLRAVDLILTVDVNGPGGLTSLSTTIAVDLDETTDFVGVADTSRCEYDVAQNQVVQAPVLATLCADQVRLSSVAPLTPSFGATDLRIEVAGFTPVDPVSGQCQTDQVIDGPTFYSSEQAGTSLCLLVSVVGGSLTIEKTVNGGPGATFDVSYAENDQTATPPAPQAAQNLTVDASSGTGSSGAVAVEAGLYSLDEIDPGPGYEPGGFTCTTDGTDATVEIAGSTYVDIDSDESVTCTFVNTFLPPPSPTPSPTTALPVASTTTSPATAAETAAAPASPGGPAGATGMLAVTGTDLSALGGTAVALLGAGLGLAALARRRRHPLS